MSDFDAVLERLLADPGFQAMLAADPGRALAGYRLSADEVELLHAQVSTETGGQRRVEQRTSKASLFGLLAPLAGAAGGLAHAVDPPTHPGGMFGGGRDVVGFGDVPPGGAGGAGGQIGTSMGGSGVIGHQLGAADVPADYHPNVDIDGDGHWDQYTVQGRADGGVDLVGDSDHDGRADFVGHDDNSDGVIDSADYDTDADGVLDTHMADVNGDGWMDTSVSDQQPQGRIGSAEGAEHRIGRAR